MRILIVEDEIRLAQNIASALREGPGYAVDVAHEGEEALLFCVDGDYDLILLDLMVPKVDGRGVLRRLRAAQHKTPVLILTAIAGPQSAIELLNAGADDYMTKPFDLGELIARIRALIRRGKGAAQALLTFGQLTLNARNRRSSAVVRPSTSRPPNTASWSI